MLRTATWLALLLALAACGPSDEDIANDLFDEISGWETWTEKAPWTGIQPSSDGTHGTHVQITFNDLAADAWGDAELPYGSISVKRGYDGPGPADARGFLTVMKRIDGYNPDQGDWFWLRIGTDGKIGTELGQSGFCASCHSVGVGYLRTVTDVPGEG
jgi:hypothetical protein